MKATQTCTVGSCGQKHYGRGYCRPHYDQWRRNDPGRPACSVRACTDLAYARGFCKRHYTRWAKHGDVTIVQKGGGWLYGADNPNWRNGEVSYSGAHMRVRTVRGNAGDRKCAHCDAQAAHWAYDHMDPFSLTAARVTRIGTPLDLEYSTDPDRYVALCVPCHKKYDQAVLGS